MGNALRRIILEQSRRANVGHIGSALSVADILEVLYTEVLQLGEDRDRFILSKGHAALALYGALQLKGLITAEELATFCGDGTMLGVHPEICLPAVDFSTGSLGMGLGMACGAALAAKAQGSSRRVYVLVSDAECNEGSLWEAALFAPHNQLDGLTAIVDLNGQQALGSTADILDTSSLADKWRAFGWDVVELDGHDKPLLVRELAARSDKPRCLIARTTFGKGVSFMEGQLKWHYMPMSADEFETAMAEVSA